MKNQLLLTYENPYWKDNPDYFLELLELSTHVGYHVKVLGSKRYLYKWMISKIPQLQNTLTFQYKVGTYVYWILNGLVDFPTCKICGKNDGYKFKNINAKGYKEYCSVKCMQNDPIIQQAKKKTLHTHFINGSYEILESQKATYVKPKDRPKKIKCHSNVVKKDLHKFQALELQLPVEENPYWKDNSRLFIQLKNLIENNPHGYINKIRLGNEYIGLKKWINDMLPSLSDDIYQISTKCYWILNGLKDFPRCKVCGNTLDKDHVKSKRTLNVGVFTGYGTYCSCDCAANDDELTKKKIKTIVEKYGKDNYCNRDAAIKTIYDRYGENAFQIIHEKGCNTKEKIYGNRNFINSKKANETKQSFSNEKKKDIRERTTRTYRQKTGFDYPSQVPENKKKIALNVAITNIVRYGVSSYTQTEDFLEKEKQTCQQKYGKDFYLQTDEFKDRSIDACNRKYKCNYYTQSKEYKQIMSNPQKMQARLDKTNETKRKNGTFNTSKLEKEAYWMLKFIFPKLQTQYKSDAYPFVADFYDPEQQNVRFEFQGSWTHGRHPFNKSNKDDVALAEKWKSKKTKYYSIANAVWTQRDPQKREIAKKNGIQLVEFWNLEEVRKFVIDFSVRNLNCGSKQIQTII